MNIDFSLFPITFFISFILLALLALYAWSKRDKGWGLPMGVVLGTTAVWYHGDACYNDYEEYISKVGQDALNMGWIQVLIFVVAFGLLVPIMHALINEKYANKKSTLVFYAKTKQLNHPLMQKKIGNLTKGIFFFWLMLMCVALYRVNFDFTGLFAPYLSDKAYPWGRARVGSRFDFLLSLAGYVQIFLAAVFGIIAAISKNKKTLTLALIVCALTFPYYIFDRTRNAMLATMLPGMLTVVFFRVRWGIFGKVTVLVLAFLLINFWFSFIIANRNDGSIAESLRRTEDFSELKNVKHGGLSMFSELGYINSFFEKGTLSPNWGARYFAELTNPIPRAIWPNKPKMGIDYAKARGFGSYKHGKSSGEVSASIATGMIGQGIVNFGGILGPIATALILSIWVAILARHDLLGANLFHLLLCAIGMTLTFNMGRDITLLVLYPYIFGLIIFMGLEHYKSWKQKNAPSRAHLKG